MRTKLDTYQVMRVLTLLLFMGAATCTSAQLGNWSLCRGAGVSVTSGDYNTMYGDSSGYRLTTGKNNSFLGGRAGFNYNGSQSTFIGYEAGYSATGVGDLTFIGKFAGRSNTFGAWNVFIGTEAGKDNTTGRSNVFVGEEAGESNTTGSRNVFVGEDAGFENTTGSDNTYIGNTAGKLTTEGGHNTAVGSEAGYDIEEGHHNTFIGDSAGVDTGPRFAYGGAGNDGSYNTCIGQASGAANEFGSFNTFVGAYAGYDNNRSNTTDERARYNTALGFAAGYRNREGRNNLVIGYRADFSGVGSSNGNRGNVLIGYYARLGQDRINYNVVIGSNARASGDNSVAIGYYSRITSSNQVYLGNSSTEVIGGPVNITVTSDGRFKQGVKEDVPGLEFITKLEPVSYTFDMDSLGKVFDQPVVNQKKSEIRYTGFLAQQVERVASELGYSFSGVDKTGITNEVYGLRYAEFVPGLVKAYQELSEKDEEQKEALKHQTRRLADLEERLNVLLELKENETVKK
ncbi:MAG: tail fiber domain-containing protein [Bacteroidia bacterium]|nr:tail fiber domain-containing protein [Bacteroidia bacterium]